jgi:DNA-binding NarL/FixJ family response regulator
VIAQYLNGAPTLPHLFGRVSEIAQAEYGFQRSVVLSLEAGMLRATHLRALVDPASDRLRRAILADPVPLRPGSAEAAFVRLAEGGRAESTQGASALRTACGIGEFALGAIIPDDTVLALLVVDRAKPEITAAERFAVQMLAQLVTRSVERLILRKRIDELSREIRYMMCSATALLSEGIEAPIAFSSEEGGAATLAPPARVGPQNAEELRNLFTHREWTIAREIISGKSNREIAAALQLSPETVKTYVSRVLRKLGAANRAEAAVRCLNLTAQSVDRPAPPRERPFVA